MDEDEQEAPAPWTPDELSRILDRYRQLADRTNNPVYVWIAIEMLSFVDTPAKPQTIPVWVTAYLFEVARNVMQLAVGLDFRIEPGKLNLTDVSSLEAIMSSETWKNDMAARQISASNAMDAIPAALGLTRTEGWNGFDSFKATTDKMEQYQSYEAMKAAGVPAKEAAYQMAKAIGVSERRLYARIQEGRDLADEEVTKPGG